MEWRHSRAISRTLASDIINVDGALIILGFVSRNKSTSMSMRRRPSSSYSIATFVLLWFVAETNSFVAINPPPPPPHHTESCRRATAANDKLTLSHLFLAPQQLGSFQELIVPSEEQDERRVALYDWSAHETCQFLTSTSSHGKDCVLFLQHDPVYTLGTASDPGFIRSDQVHMVDVVRMDRGGEVTYHGPGQLVVYPILDFLYLIYEVTIKIFTGICVL